MKELEIIRLLRAQNYIIGWRKINPKTKGRKFTIQIILRIFVDYTFREVEFISFFFFPPFHPSSPNGDIPGAITVAKTPGSLPLRAVIALISVGSPLVPLW